MSVRLPSLALLRAPLSRLNPAPRGAVATSARSLSSYSHSASPRLALALARPVPPPQRRRLTGKTAPAWESGRDVSWAKKGDVTYGELKPYSQSPTGEITVIDVREPSEVAEGMVPGAVNVPLSRFSDAFHPNKGADFRNDFAFDRPAFDAPIVFYCRSGKRSQQALEEAQRGGWWNVRNYRGSWLDWTQQEEARNNK